MYELYEKKILYYSGPNNTTVQQTVQSTCPRLNLYNIRNVMQNSHFHAFTDIEYVNHFTVWRFEYHKVKEIKVVSYSEMWNKIPTHILNTNPIPLKKVSGMDASMPAYTYLRSKHNPIQTISRSGLADLATFWSCVYTMGFSSSKYGVWIQIAFYYKI